MNALEGYLRHSICRATKLLQKRKEASENIFAMSKSQSKDRRDDKLQGRFDLIEELEDV